MLGVTGIQKPWQARRYQLEQRHAEEQQRFDLLSAIRIQKAQLEKYEERALLEGGASVLTSEITRLASKAGVQIESLAPESEVPLGPYTRSQIRLSATSTFPDLLKFLRSLEDHNPLLKLDQLEMGESSETSTYRTAATEKEAHFQETDRQKARLLISAFSRRSEAR